MKHRKPAYEIRQSQVSTPSTVLDLFLWLGFMKTSGQGMIALVIPYEWVSRPSAEPIRSFIQGKRWDVDVYRLHEPVFDGVLTTASITIIDKRGNSSAWSYYDISRDR